MMQRENHEGKNKEIKVLRAKKHWEKAGAAYVRVHAMARQHNIPLNVEFDDIDADPETKHIVLLDDFFPIATCRMFEEKPGVLHIGRVIVIPEYRKRGLGVRVIQEAEDWGRDLGYHTIVLDSRDVAVGFYEKMGYRADFEKAFFDTFQCIPMSKALK